MSITLKMLHKHVFGLISTVSGKHARTHAHTRTHVHTHAHAHTRIRTHT